MAGTVFPSSIDTFGSWGPSAEQFFGKDGGHLKNVAFEPGPFDFFIQRSSAALQRTNAYSVLGTIPTGDGMDKFFRVSDFNWA